MNYEEDLKIDRYNLDIEWLRQPSIYMKYIEEAAKADKAVRRAREKIEIIKAELHTIIRVERENQNLKTTKDILDSLIIQTPEYQNAVNNHIDMIEMSKIINGAVDAFNQRKNALENAVKLLLAGFFSAPKDEKKDGESQTEKSLNNASKKQREKLKRKRSKK